jgi:hypothetical protein
MGPKKCLFNAVEVDECCGASTSERKRQAFCACWTNQSLPLGLFQHDHVSNASTFLQNITPTYIPLDHIGACYCSTRSMAIYTYMYMIGFHHCLPDMARRQSAA